MPNCLNRKWCNFGNWVWEDKTDLFLIHTNNFKWNQLHLEVKTMHLCCNARFFNRLFVIFSSLYLHNLLQDLMYVLSPTNTQAPYVSPERAKFGRSEMGCKYRYCSLYDACCVSAVSVVLFNDEEYWTDDNEIVIIILHMQTSTTIE